MCFNRGGVGWGVGGVESDRCKKKTLVLWDQHDALTALTQPKQVVPNKVANDRDPALPVPRLEVMWGSPGCPFMSSSEPL